MDASEYIDAVTGQMRCKRARAMVAKELSDHIEDQTEDYLHQGMSEEEAKSEAVRQMGDGVEVGTEMDRIHRPKLDKHTLIMVGILSVAALFMQTIVVHAMRRAGTATALSAGTIPPQILVGALLMIGILYVDYTILAKRPWIPWMVLFVVAFLWGRKIVSVDAIYLPGRSARWVMYAMIALFLPAYACVIYYFRTKGWKGLLASVVLLFVQAGLYRRSTWQLSFSLVLCFAGMLLLSYALWKGWYGISKKKSLWALWGTTIGVSGLGMLFLMVHDSYYRKRIEAFLFSARDSQGAGYLTFHMQERLADLAFIGKSSNLDGMPVESAQSFFVILTKLGIIPGILMLLGMLVLFFCMLKGVSRQKDVLGSLLGMACVMGLAIPALGHIMSCLTLMPYTDLFIPFLYPGWVANLASYTLLGLYLSVYRYKDVVA